MTQLLSRLIDRASDFFASRKGLLPLVGLGLIIINFALRLVAPGWLSQTDFLLHLGIILAILGLMLSRVL